MDKLCKWRAVLFSVTAMALGAPAALADEQPAPWIKMTATNGCTFFMYDYEDVGGAWHREAPWTWTGGCTNGLASGSGDLTTIRSSRGISYSTGYRGMMIDGYMDGRIERLIDTSRPASYYYQTFEMGCGQAAAHVYCMPATTSVASAPPPVPKPVAKPQEQPAPSSSSRLGDDAAKILTTLGAEDEDRVFAMLAELAQTGRIDLAREAEIQLARRFPDSPLVGIAARLISALAAAPPASAPATGGGSYQSEGLRQTVEALYGTAKNISTSGPAVYEFTVVRNGSSVPISAEVSSSGEYIWVHALLMTDATPPHTAQLALQRVSTLQPTMIWDSGGLRLGRALMNRSLTDEDIRKTIDQVADDVLATSDIWAN